MRLDYLMRSHRGLKVLAFGSLCLNGVLGAGLMLSTWTLHTQEKIVVLVPPDLAAETAIARAGADTDYKRAWALHVAQTLGSVTPGNLKFIKPTLEPLLDAGIYHEVIVRLEAELDTIQRDRVSVRFEPHEVVFEAERDRTFVSGLAVTSSLVGAETRTRVTYEMEIDVAAYRPVIRYLNTYQGKPRTAELIAQREAQAGSAATRGAN